MRTTIALAMGVAMVAAAACGGGMDPGDDSTGDDSAGDDSTGDDSAGDDDVPDGFQPLVSGEWSMAPGDEGYWCVRATVTEETYIHAYRPIAPLGTHHTALAVDPTGGADGGFPCDASFTGFRLLFGSGVGTEPYALPDGVAMKLDAGTQVILNLHLFNTGDAELTGTSGIEVEQIAAADVVHEAEVVYAFDLNLTVPMGESTFTGECTINGDSTIVGLFPHMHLLGRHMTVAARRSGSPGVTTLHDEPYAFGDQLNYAITPYDALDGDTIEYGCGFDNQTGAPVQFGESTEDEMCVVGLYRYPAITGGSLCTH